MSNIGPTDAVTGMEIAVIGMSGRFPGAKDIHEFWDNLKMRVESLSFFSDEEVEAAGVAPELVKDSNYVKAWMILEGIEYFDSVFFNYTPKEVEVMEPQTRLFHECAWEALENSGYNSADYKGTIGVIAGASSSSYWEAVSFLSGHTGWGDSLLINKDFLCTRIAYKLNLTGPASMVQTACSTSLVGIHQACRALLTGECKMMLVGGVGLSLPQKQGYMYREGLILASDGRCRAFDAHGRGTIGGNGIGIIILKRLKNALEDGDYIHAIIKSTAVNNDGSGKVGYTAPAVEGQTAVIRTALRMAKVNSDSILYVETHGTGTPLGDSIEIEALKKAFDTKKKAYCALGAVKTNIGHLDAAAGIAGLIKAVLVLKHKLIPPNLNFETPNPTLNLIDSPFYVNTICRKLEGGKMPLRAGVSSFGIGGTNAHVVLEEAPHQEPISPARDYQLFLLSAKTPEALQQQAERLKNYLQGHPGVNAADVAYTLQTGRRHFAYRKMVVSPGAREAITMLTASREVVMDFNSPPDRHHNPGSLPGGGLVNQGQQPYEDQPVFLVPCWRDSLPEGKEELRVLLENAGQWWLGGRSLDWSAFYSREKRNRIPLPTYPFHRQRYWKDIIINGNKADILTGPSPVEHSWPSLRQEDVDHMARLEEELWLETGMKGIPAYDGLEDTVNRLCSSCVYYFLQSVIDTGAGQIYSLEELKKQLKVLPKFEKFFHFFIDVLEQDGLLRVQDNYIRFMKGKDQVGPPGKLKEEAQKKYPEFKGWFDLLEYCASYYKQALSGEIEAIEVLYPGGKPVTQMEPFKVNLEYGTRLYCMLLEKIVASLVNRFPHERGVRILEIGGGNGILTKRLAPVLKEHDRISIYHFTDPGNYFVSQAKKDGDFACLEFIKFGKLDISRPPLEQGYRESYFDLVVGLNILHAVPFIDDALTNLENLLVPGGVILLIETIGNYRWISMVNGLAEWWWYFQDEKYRKGSPLLSLEKWIDIFKTRGFVNVNGFQQDRTDRWTSDTGLIIAQRSGQVKEKVKEDPLLPVPGSDERSNISAPYTPPTNEIEKKLVQLWQDFLGYQRVGILDDFNQLGIESLSAISLIVQVHKEFDVRIPFPVFFERLTIKGLAHYIREAKKDIYPALKSVEEREYYALSSAQKRLYILQQMEPADTSYNISYAVILAGEIEKEKLEVTFRQLITRHESLRTSVIIIDDEPVQRIHRQVKFDFEFYEPGEGETPVLLVKNFIRPFAMNRAPLLRVGLCSQSKAHHVLMVDIHHVIADGVALAIFIREFMALYEGAALAAVKVQYKDYSEWQRSQKYSQFLEQQEQFWLKEFEVEPLLLDLPIDYPRPPVQTYEGATVTFEIDSAGTSDLNILARQQGTTLFVVLFSMFNIFIHKLSGNEDLVIGTAVAGRRVVGVDSTIGCFINTLAMRNYFIGEQTYKEFLKSIHQRTLQAFENQDYQFEDLVEKVVKTRNLNRNTLCEVMFLLQNMDNPEIQIPGLKLKPLRLERRAILQDLNLIAIERKSTLDFIFEYSTRLFKEHTIQRFIAHFKRITSRLGKAWDMRLNQLEIISAAERRRILCDFNHTQVPYPGEKTIHRLFEEQEARTPGHIAIVYKYEHLTYRKLNEKANQLARLLRKRGTGPGNIIGVMIKPSIDMAVVLIGILKAGGAYLPIDPAAPQRRILTMLRDSKASILLNGEKLTRNFSFSSLRNFNPGQIEPRINAPRAPIKDLDNLPLPDRSLVDYSKYHQFIGEAPARNTITLQGTRGCPFNCAFCHKIWSKQHVFRSARHIFNEVKTLYDIGVRRFEFIDDIFNLKKENSRRFFELIIKNGLKVQLFFTNGLRGDILTGEDIDLMVEAGTVDFDFSLESACPRIQKLINKNLNLEKLKENINYIIKKHPQSIIELQTIHGFPTETEEEAMMTLEFIKALEWIDFPYVHLLRIYPETDMAKIAVKNGIPMEAIAESVDLAFHELSSTMPFSKGFTQLYQTKYLYEYFLLKERFLAVLPKQMKLLTANELVQKYDSFFPTKIRDFPGLLETIGISMQDLNGVEFLPENHLAVPEINEKLAAVFPVKKPVLNAMRVLLLDISLYFSGGEEILYDVVNEPLGLMYLLTVLHRDFGDKIHGKIAKSRVDFDSYRELKTLLDEFKPHVIGIRSLSFYKDFFHATVSLVRQWGIGVPIIAGGPYATSNCAMVLQDPGVDLVVVGEGELTFSRLIGEIMNNNGRLPSEEVLNTINGIAFIEKEKRLSLEQALCDVISWGETDPGLTLRQEQETNLEYRNRPTDLAYIIYTSGSTGTPKGVMVEHRNVNAYIHAYYREFDISAKDTILLQAVYTFDTFVEEFYPVLLKGGKVVVGEREEILDIERLCQLIARQRVSIFGCSPLLLNELNRYISPDLPGSTHAPGLLKSIRTFISGGDVLKEKQVDHLVKIAAVYNTYGPTETTVCATYGNYLPGRNVPISIGKPISNYSVYIVDKENRLLPGGIAGELCISGKGVARGYLNRPLLTWEKFIENPFVPGEKLYKTGDLARWRSEGNVEFLGRIDHQVKVRGYRVEMGEIEHQVLKLEEIKESLVITREDKSRLPVIHCYFVANGELPVSKITDFLSRELPDYMIPTHFIQLEEIPLTPSGKVDTQSLSGPSTPGSYPDEDYVKPGSPLEKSIAAVWQEVLTVQKVGLHDNFFELGGHSLNIIQTKIKLNSLLKRDIPVVALFRYPTISDLARHLGGEEKGENTITTESSQLAENRMSMMEETIRIMGGF